MISREEARTILKEMHDYMHEGYITNLAYGGKQDETMECDIEALSVAIEALSQPERPKGRWVRASEEKPNSTRHIIYADGGLISHYGYYLQPKDKWYTNWKCEEEIPEPVMWREMPEVPKESILDECGC